jgi:hypothetical protein
MSLMMSHGVRDLRIMKALKRASTMQQILIGMRRQKNTKRKKSRSSRM